MRPAVIAVALAFCAAARGLCAQEVGWYEIATDYNRVRQYSTATVSLGDVAPGVELSFLSTQGGPKLRAPTPTASMMFTVKGSTWQYLHYHSLACLVDDRKLGELATTHDGRVGEGYVIEFIEVTLSASQLARLAKANSVVCALGSTEFELNDDAREAISRFRVTLTGKTPPPPRVSAQERQERKDKASREAIDRLPNPASSPPQ